MAHVRQTSTILLAAAATLIVAPGAPAMAAATCAPADPFQRVNLYPATYYANARFGAVTVTGNFNGDGFADLAVGAPGDQTGTVAGGTVSVYLGSATGLGAPRRLSQSNVSGFAPESGDKFGAALAAGDFTGDGKADLAVGAPGEAIGETAGAGSISIFRGTATGLETTGAGYAQSALGGTSEANDQFGSALAAGNFAGDGKAELAIGAPNESPGTTTVTGGEVTVVKWETDKLVKGWVLAQASSGSANEAGDRFGAAVAAGNVTGDGKDDVITGLPGEDINSTGGVARVDTGSIIVFPGGATAIGNGVVKNQGEADNESGDNYGAALAVGDFDRTGGAEIAVGVPGETTAFGGANVKSGSVSVIRGPFSATAGTVRLEQAHTGEASRAGDRWGASFAVGDLNADTYPDLMVGAPGVSKGGLANSGHAAAFRGRADLAEGLLPARVIQQPDILASSEAGDEFGGSVALGDFDGDGRAEGVVTAPGESPGSNARSGSAVVLDNLLPPGTSRVIEQYATTSALQSPPVDSQLAPIRYAYVDNVGGPKIGVQVDPQVINSVVWDGAGSLEAVFTGRPAIGQTADGKGVVAVRSTKGEVWIRTQTSTAANSAWGAWVNYGGPDIGAITMSTLDNGRPAVFGIGARGELVVLPQTVSGRFGAWQGTGLMNLTGDPVTATVAGGTRVFVRDSDGNLHTALYAGLALAGCAPVGDAVLGSSPSVVVYPGSRLRVFGTTPDNRLVTIGQDVDGVFEPTWATIQPTGVAGPPSAVLDAVTGRITVVAPGADRAIWGATETLQGSATFGDWAVVSPDGAAPAYTDVVMVPFTGGGGASYLFTYRDQNNVQWVFPARRDNFGAVRSYTQKSLPKAGK
jgi:hypothetical protein